MLIQLDESLAESDEEFSQSELNAFSNLAIAASEGNHYLLASRKLASILATHNALAERERTVYRIIDNRYSTLAGLADEIPNKVKVGRYPDKTRTTSGNQTKIKLPLDFFSTTSSVQATTLLCENLSDCKLIDELSKSFILNNNFGNINTSFKFHSGGGSQVAKEAEELIDQNNCLFLTIVDSDKDCPSGSLGSTAKSARKVYNKLKPVVSELAILEAKELENLLPDSFYKCMMNKRIIDSGSVEFLCSLININCSQTRHYIDIKSKLTLEKLLSTSGRPDDYSSMWSNVISNIKNKKIKTTSSIANCLANNTYKNPGKCECILKDSINTNLIERGVKASQENRKEFWADLPSALEETINKLGKTVFSWGCSASFSPNT